MAVVIKTSKGLNDSQQLPLQE